MVAGDQLGAWFLAVFRSFIGNAIRGSVMLSCGSCGAAASTSWWLGSKTGCSTCFDQLGLWTLKRTDLSYEQFACG